MTATTLFGQTYPEDKDPYVNDYADLLNDAEETQLRQTLEQLWLDNGIDLVVVTIRQTADYGHEGPIEPFATGLFNAWGVGDAGQNDGILLLVSRNDRAVRFEVGSGYGNKLDQPLQNIVRSILRQFRQEKYADGIQGAVTSLLYIVDSPADLPDSTAIELEQGDSKNVIMRVMLFFWLPAAFLLMALNAGGIKRVYRILRRNNKRICPNDGSRMYRYIEETEDEVLNKGQQLEERLQSIDYDVWYCDQCEHITIESYKKSNQPYGACVKCGYLTADGDSEIITLPTKTLDGTRQITWTCRHCDHVEKVAQTIPAMKDDDEIIVKSQNVSSWGRGRSASGRLRNRKRPSRSRAKRRGGGKSRGGGASGHW